MVQISGLGSVQLFSVVGCFGFELHEATRNKVLRSVVINMYCFIVFKPIIFSVPFNIFFTITEMTPDEQLHYKQRCRDIYLQPCKIPNDYR